MPLVSDIDEERRKPAQAKAVGKRAPADGGDDRGPGGRPVSDRDGAWPEGLVYSPDIWGSEDGRPW